MGGNRWCCFIPAMTRLAGKLEKGIPVTVNRVTAARGKPDLCTKVILRFLIDDPVSTMAPIRPATSP